MASLPVWRRRHKVWLVVVGEQSWNWKIYLLTFVQIGPKMCQFSWESVKICDRWFSIKSKMAENLVGQKLMPLDLSWSKDSNCTSFVKFGPMNPKLCSWMHFKLWRVGGAREYPFWARNFLTLLMALSWIHVPNFTTFYHCVLGAAIDFNCRRK